MKYVKKPIPIDAIQIPEWLHTKNKSLADLEAEFGASIVRHSLGGRVKCMQEAKSGDLFIWIGAPVYPFNKMEEEPSFEVKGATVISSEGIHETKPGDWIITGVRGERYFCRNDIFVETYDAVES